MEQQKILWIIFSVALLLIVVVGAAFIWFLPSERRITLGKEVLGTPAGEDAGAAKDMEFDPIEWVRTSDEFPGLEEDRDAPESEDFVIVYGEVEIDGEEVELKREEPETPEPVAVSPEPAVQPRVERREPEPAPVRETVQRTPIRQEPEPEPREVRVTEYWIQAGSYNSKTRAEQVKERLASQGVISRITSKEVDGKTYFRVRIGPYANQMEASKFLDWIRAVQGFENSYVSQVSVKRVVN